MIEIILKQHPELFDSEQYIDLMKHTLHRGKSDAFSVLMSALLEHDLAQR